MNVPDESQIRQECCEVTRFMNRRYVSEAMLHNASNGNVLLQMIQDEGRHMVIELHYTLLRGPCEQVVEQHWHEHPEDWWQAFRQRWLPKWWLKRHPVKLSRVLCQYVTRYNVCPHLPHDPHSSHVEFLIEEPQQ